VLACAASVGDVERHTCFCLSPNHCMIEDILPAMLQSTAGTVLLCVLFDSLLHAGRTNSEAEEKGRTECCRENEKAWSNEYEGLHPRPRIGAYTTDHALPDIAKVQHSKYASSRPIVPTIDAV